MDKKLLTYKKRKKEYSQNYYKTLPQNLLISSDNNNNNTKLLSFFDQVSISDVITDNFNWVEISPKLSEYLDSFSKAIQTCINGGQKIDKIKIEKYDTMFKEFLYKKGMRNRLSVPYRRSIFLIRCKLEEAYLILINWNIESEFEAGGIELLTNLPEKARLYPISIPVYEYSLYELHQAILIFYSSFKTIRYNHAIHVYAKALKSRACWYFHQKFYKNEGPNLCKIDGYFDHFQFYKKEIEYTVDKQQRIIYCIKNTFLDFCERYFFHIEKAIDAIECLSTENIETTLYPDKIIFEKAFDFMKQYSENETLVTALERETTKKIPDWLVLEADFESYKSQNPLIEPGSFEVVNSYRRESLKPLHNIMKTGMGLYHLFNTRANLDFFYSYNNFNEECDPIFDMSTLELLNVMFESQVTSKKTIKDFVFFPKDICIPLEDSPFFKYKEPVIINTMKGWIVREPHTRLNYIYRSFLEAFLIWLLMFYETNSYISGIMKSNGLPKFIKNFFLDTKYEKNFDCVYFD